MIELLILPVGLSGSLPELVGAADNFHFKGSFHFRCFQVVLASTSRGKERCLSGQAWQTNAYLSSQFQMTSSARVGQRTNILSGHIFFGERPRSLPSSSEAPSVTKTVGRPHGHKSGRAPGTTWRRCGGRWFSGTVCRRDHAACASRQSTD
jgi:hypothetical protein